MKHLDEIRLMELALEPGSAMDAEEKAHLAQCAECREQLESEKELTTCIEQMPAFRAPDHFVAHAVAKFSAEYLKTVQTPVLYCSISILLLTGGMFWLAVVNLAQFVSVFATTVTAMHTFLRAIYVVLTALPVLHTALPFGFGLALLLSATLLAQLAKKEAVLK